MNINLGINSGEDTALLKVCEFLSVPTEQIEQMGVVDQIKQACLIRFNRVLGIRFKYGQQSQYFNFFSNIMGEAVCQHLNLPIKIAPDKFRLIKYDGVNLVYEVRKMLENFMVEEAFLQAFEFLDKYLYLI